MSDDLKITAPQDPKKININQKWEVDYWMQKFNITEKKLIEAIKTAGVNVKDVKEWLNDH